MALDFTSNPGGVFARIGRILKVAYVLTPYEAGVPTLFNNIDAQYQSTLQDVGGNVAIQANQLTRTASSVMAFASNTALQTLTEMVAADTTNAGPSQSLSAQAVMTEVIRQMKAQSKTVQVNAITVSPAALSTTVGNAVLVTSTKRGDGLVQENSIPEYLRLQCTNDAYTGTATAGQEVWTLQGAPVTGGVWDYDYPTGSGASLVINAVSADGPAVQSNGTVLTNGNFESWTGVTPALNNFTLGGSSVWGTDVKQNSAIPNRGTYCLQFVAGTGINSIVYQAFGNGSTGTGIVPAGLFSYQVNLWVRRVSGAPATGVLTVELTDGTGTVTQDAQGNNNSFTITCSSLTTSYVAYSGTFRLNGTPPATIWLRLRMSTLLTTGDIVVDDLCMAQANAMYLGGPSLNVFSGATQTELNDGWNVQVTNDYGGASYLGTFQTGFDRLFGMKGLGLLLPSSGSPNIANTLITS
jgi:hypothetical protein